MYEFLVFFVSLAGGVVAAISGFGIGSLITPVLSLTLGTKLAVALVAIPHFVATLVRFWFLRRHLDKKLFLSFGVLSAAGGLVGAFLHSHIETNALTLIFGLLLLFSGFMGVSGISNRLRFHGPVAWIAGALSGLLGGLVGNQGGIRAAALLGFNVPSKESFVATATAIGLVVDLARLPIYLGAEFRSMTENTSWILVCTAGVLAGTFIGMKVLRNLDEGVFKQVVSGLIFLLGVFMIYKGMD